MIPVQKLFDCELLHLPQTGLIMAYTPPQTYKLRLEQEGICIETVLNTLCYSGMSNAICFIPEFHYE
jgi:hypothetical protein